jgi:hypothetical protein
VFNIGFIVGFEFLYDFLNESENDTAGIATADANAKSERVKKFRRGNGLLMV